MTHLYVTWLIRMWHDSFVCDMTHSWGTWLMCMWHDSCICGMMHFYMYASCRHLGDVTFRCLIHMWYQAWECDVTHSYVTWLMYLWHESFLQVYFVSAFRACDMTHSHVTWLMYMWNNSFPRDMTHVSVTWLTLEWRDSSICDMTHVYVVCRIPTCMLCVGV